MLDIYIKNFLLLKSDSGFCETYNILSYNGEGSLVISDNTFQGRDTLLTNVGYGIGISDFWKIVSGINLILSTFVFDYNNKKWLRQNIETEFNFVRVRNLLYWIGSVTILFHVTLLYVFQLLNHIAIILLLREYIIILLSLNITKKTFFESSYKNIVGFIHTILEYLIIIISSYFVNIKFHIFSFHVIFKILEFVVVFIFYNLSKSLNKIIYYHLTKKCRNHGCTKMLDTAQENIKNYVKLRKILKQQIKKSVCFYILSISLWIFQNSFCNYITNGLWYLFVSFGIYYLNTIVKLYIQIDIEFYTKIL